MGYQHQTRPRTPLIRDPADWARDTGWISPTKARNDARKLRQLACIMRDTIPDPDDVGVMWARECDRIAKRLDPESAAVRER